MAGQGARVVFGVTGHRLDTITLALSWVGMPTAEDLRTAIGEARRADGDDGTLALDLAEAEIVLAALHHSEKQKLIDRAVLAAVIGPFVAAIAERP